MRTEIPDPWLGFLRDVDRTLTAPVEVHCAGGFVLAVLWNLPRPTGDVDFIDADPREAGSHLIRIAGEGTELARTHGIYFHCVTVAECPEAYVSRLVDVTPRGFKRLRVRALEVHDLVLAKLGRNSARDRADAGFLISKGVLDKQVLKERFEAELRPYVLNETRHTDALNLWLDTLFDDDASTRP